MSTTMPSACAPWLIASTIAISSVMQLILTPRRTSRAIRGNFPGISPTA